MTDPNEPTSSEDLIEQFLRSTHAGAVVASLAGGLAHHFNNLLGGVLGLATLAPSLGKEELVNLCTRVRKQVDDASRLTRVLLSVTRFKESSAAGTVCEISGQSDDLVALLEACAGSAVDIVLTRPDGEVWAGITSVAYSELLLAVLIGSVSAGRIEGEKVTIRAQVEVDGDACMVTVRDPSAGPIDGDSDSLTRAVNSGAHPLAPLTGLAVARAIAEQFGGSVNVDSTSKELCITIRLPRVKSV